MYKTPGSLEKVALLRPLRLFLAHCYVWLTMAWTRFVFIALALSLFAGCASIPKRLSYSAIKSTAMDRDMRYAVYQPEDRAPHAELPLVVFLHGGGDDVDCFDKAGVGQSLDRAIAEGRVPPVVVAVPQGDLGFWENWADGSREYRDWVLKEMLPIVRKKYNTRACPEGCHVMGISMGGHGSLRFAFKQPEHFSSVTALSAPIFDTQQMLNFRDSFWWGLFVPVGRIWGKETDPRVVMRDDLYAQWIRQEDLKGLRLRIAWGDDDRKGVIRTNARFVEHLEKHQLEFTHEVFAGEHEWDAWVPAIERAIAIQVGD